MATKPKASAKPKTRKTAARVRKATKVSAPGRTARVRPARSRSAAPSATIAPKRSAASPVSPTTEVQVVASKFHRDVEERILRPAAPPASGESRLQLLARDPETLHVWWDLSAALVEDLKRRLGSRSFAVSTLTLRLMRDGEAPAAFHLGRRARSRYLKIAQGGSFTAEIGFTTPAGRFEPAARSAPCFVPLGAARAALMGSRERLLGSYREGRPLVRAKAAAVDSSEARTTASASPSASPSTEARPTLVARRPLGGASDLYRR